MVLIRLPEAFPTEPGARFPLRNPGPLSPSGGRRMGAMAAYWSGGRDETSPIGCLLLAPIMSPSGARRRTPAVHCSISPQSSPDGLESRLKLSKSLFQHEVKVNIGPHKLRVIVTAAANRTRCAHLRRPMRAVAGYNANTSGYSSVS